MKVSVGIFAHNESQGIAVMVRDLYAQDFIARTLAAGGSVEVICVANGCTDDTAEAASAALAECSGGAAEGSALTWRVDVLSIASKSNAWNHFVHEASRPDADYLVCLDADIRMPQRTCISGVLDLLVSDAQATVAVDVPLKDIVVDDAPGLGRAINRRLTQFKRATRGRGVNAIAGSLFCGRADALRRIWLPRGLVRVMDGFIKAMVVTDCFTAPTRHARIVCAEDCFHVFSAYTGLARLFRHNRNLLVGIVVNAALYDYLWQTSSPARHAGQVIRHLNTEEPDWISRVIRERLTPQVRRRLLARHVIDPVMTWWRSPDRRLGYVVPALGLAVLRLPVALGASRTLRRGKYEW